jgi:4-diphosphocytidyl-2-C-methyl-D-erythritol kinase
MLTLEAHAKINLGLAVIAKRGDGFHEIDTLMVRLALHDTVRLEPNDRGVTLEVSGAELGDYRDNLAYRAALLYFRESDVGRGVHLHLTKRIPIAAGLGGGSSDAAAVLSGLVRLYPADIDLRKLALELGSDVPFFLLDASAARARGRGERLEPIKLPSAAVVLANPRVEVKSGFAYEHLQNFSRRLPVAEIVASLDRGEAPRLFNALQPGVLRNEPRIRPALGALRSADLSGVLMSGSGATCFGLAQGVGHADEVAGILRHQHPSWWVKSTTFG